MEGSYFQNTKDCTNDFVSCLEIVWAIDVEVMLFLKDASGLSKSTNGLDSILFIMSFLSQFIGDHFLELQLYC